ncbi:MAG: hypothetical protein NVS2B11_16240 [Acetobacteraceae bacterium]
MHDASLPTRERMLLAGLAGFADTVGSHVGLPPFNIARRPGFERGIMASNASASVGNAKVKPTQSVATTERAVRHTLNAGAVA